MGNLEGQVAFITGGARGQGRSHALRLATDGADIVLVDICHNIASNKYDLATPADLHATAGMVEALDRRAVEIQADVRDFAALASALDGAVAQLGRLDIVVANAGIAPMSFDDDAHLGEQAFRDVVDVNLGGVWNTCRAALPHLIAGGRGGAMVLTSSTAGIKAVSYTHLDVYKRQVELSGTVHLRDRPYLDARRAHVHQETGQAMVRCV